MHGMFEGAEPVAADPILGLMAEFARDPRPDRIDLGVGVYRNAHGQTPIMAAVRHAERLRLRLEDSKAYLGMAGDDGFNRAIERLTLADSDALQARRATTIQTPGGTAALRVAAELVRARRPESTVWVSDPTWNNHPSLFRAAGLPVRNYPYFDAEQGALRFDAMLAALADAAAGDVVLLHVCCHNPTGVDPNPLQWRRLSELIRSRRLLPLLDMAYHGFADSLDDDAAGLRHLVDAVDELIVCVSCSKTFGLYRERTGACTLVARNRHEADVARSLLLGVVRNLYSMPPAHGAALVRLILDSRELTASWRDELDAMRCRIGQVRRTLAERLGAATGRDFDHLARQHGLFSFLGVGADSIRALRDRHAVYLVDSGRINIAGLNDDNLEPFVQAVADVLRGEHAAAPPRRRLMTSAASRVSSSMSQTIVGR